MNQCKNYDIFDIDKSKNEFVIQELNTSTETLYQFDKEKKFENHKTHKKLAAAKSCSIPTLLPEIYHNNPFKTCTKVQHYSNNTIPHKHRLRYRKNHPTENFWILGRFFQAA